MNDLLLSRRGTDADAIRKGLMDHLVHTVGKDPFNATKRDWFMALATLVRDRLAEEWMEWERENDRVGRKRVYYLSLEFLIGRVLINNLINLGLYEVCAEVVGDLGLTLDEVADMEHEAALGNGGLGRLAACFLDSMATLGIAGYGYGLRYEYGMFSQRIENGAQVEAPDKWLQFGNPWEFARPALTYPILFGGKVASYRDAAGRLYHDWVDASEIWAMAYDVRIPGYGGRSVATLRLWAAKASQDFDLGYFNTGNYIEAVKRKDETENLTRVLYPSDSTEMGRELRFKQEYFFVAASLQNIIERYLRFHEDFDDFPDRVAIQLNDTHPALAVPELMRQLMDIHGLGWEEAWKATTGAIAYTNHTLLPEALETWPVALFETLLPRHLAIIFEINHRFLDEVRRTRPGDDGVLRRLSLVSEGPERRIRMAHLAVLGSHKVNGVAEIHTRLLRETVFPEFDQLFPGKFINETNGVTPRRWLLEANPPLSRLIGDRIGADWVTDLDRLAEVERWAPDPDFRGRFAAVKQANKRRLAEWIGGACGISVDPASLFDVQVKRIHEYKRQLLNILQVIARYVAIRDEAGPTSPRTVIFAGKAAPGYVLAKLVIRLIHGVADVVNNDPRIGDRLKVVFVPNYNVSKAEKLFVAADLSEQISTAGTEASGTGNMKLALNGALTIGTLDGANIEIRDRVGPENIFIFGMEAAEVAALRPHYDPHAVLEADSQLREVLAMVAGGFFSPCEPDLYKPLVDSLTVGGDRYMVLADFRAYLACQEAVDRLWQDRTRWVTRSILNTARSGFFSSDRTIRGYARDIWGLSA